jgi:uncharacterized protein
MLKRLLKKWLPHRDTIKNEKGLSWLHGFLHDPKLWHINRRTVAGGAASGLLVAFIPLPLQMLLAALIAITARVNVLVAIATTWISNPITFLPINYIIYKVGGWISGENKNNFASIKEFRFSINNLSGMYHEFFSWFVSLGKPYLIGLPIVSIGAALLGYVIIRLLWRIVITVHYYHRKRKIIKNKQS